MGRYFAGGSARAFAKGWDSLIERCQRVRPDLFQDIRFHDLRHTFTTILKGRGISYEVRQALLGHSMRGTTDRYSHGSPEWDKQLMHAVTVLNDALEEMLQEDMGASARNAVEA